MEGYSPIIPFAPLLSLSKLTASRYHGCWTKALDQSGVCIELRFVRNTKTRAYERACSKRDGNRIRCEKICQLYSASGNWFLGISIFSLFLNWIVQLYIRYIYLYIYTYMYIYLYKRNWNYTRGASFIRLALPECWNSLIFWNFSFL